MTQIVFATHNAHKIAEAAAILGSRISILSLADIGCLDEIPETASTLEGNALLKARYVYDSYKLACFADDTGLEVEALNNAPGVYSARYAGEPCNPQANIDKLLAELKGVENRRAKFRTAVALITQSGEYLFEGEIKGRIIEERRGGAGFGYDPVFIPNGSEKTFAELSAEEKNLISHRGKAIGRLASFLKTIVK
ncbi:MAG: non-canonical purine NTP diphosphatase [Tannerellaceae bacterium]|jgi:XTP/dITP diphosphohydrolase|nr:non-canonical purine NTP diphosphatase [Tannerellaceae bacterium]